MKLVSRRRDEVDIALAYELHEKSRMDQLPLEVPNLAIALTIAVLRVHYLVLENAGK